MILKCTSHNMIIYHKTYTIILFSQFYTFYSPFVLTVTIRFEDTRSFFFSPNALINFDEIVSECPGKGLCILAYPHIYRLLIESQVILLSTGTETQVIMKPVILCIYRNYKKIYGSLYIETNSVSCTGSISSAATWYTGKNKKVSFYDFTWSDFRFSL